MSAPPLVSVIVPVYNSEEYLHQCIDSILNQTYTNIELLLINDGSQDRSGEICDEFAEKDERIRVFYQKNRGVSSARNLGLNNANGKWVSFVDSDDWEDKETYMEILNFVNYKKVDLVIWGIKFITGSYIQNRSFQTNALVNEKTDIQELLMQCDMERLLESPCNKLYLLRIIKKTNLEFDVNLSNNEDIQFNCNYLQNVNAISIYKKSFYNYRKDINRPSLSNTFPENILEIIKGSIKMRTNLFSSYSGHYRDKYDRFLEKQFCNFQLGLKLSMYNNGISAKNRRKKWKQFIKEVKVDQFKGIWYFHILKTKNIFFIDIVFKVRYMVQKHFPDMFLIFKKSINRNLSILN